MKKIRKALRKSLEEMENIVIKISRGRFDRLLSDDIIAFSVIELVLFLFV